ncbi:MAG: RNA-protein complex protein Nop10 [Methanosarcinales archaeon]|nr:RNA-protein complex protein Nop10 [Methanosarcinales archaeon]
MKSKILKCIKCNIYTLKDICPKCKSETKNSRPAKFSLEDPYGKYRRIMKKEILFK